MKFVFNPPKPFKEMTNEEFEQFKIDYNNAYSEFKTKKEKTKRKEEEKKRLLLKQEQIEKKLKKIIEKTSKFNPQDITLHSHEKGAKPIFHIICARGHKGLYSSSDVSANRNFCKTCNSETTFTPAKAQEKILKKNLILKDVYKTVRDPISVQCINCTSTFETTYQKIYISKYPCPTCRPIRPATKDILSAMCEESGFKFIEKIKKYYYLIECVQCATQTQTSHKYLKQKKAKCLQCEGTRHSQLNGSIYKLTNPSGKAYIGQTIRSIQERINEHKQMAYKEDSPSYDTLIARAIRKYGFENFKIEILHSQVRWDDLDKMEIQEIINHKSNDCVYGYNMTEGGKAGNANAHAAVRTFQKRVEKEEKLKEKAEKKRAMNFGKNMEIEIKRFQKEQMGKKNYELEKLKEKLRRSASAKKVRHQPKTSQYVGVCWDKRIGKFKANIKVAGKKIHLGVFECEKDAAIAYDEAAKKHRGNKANLNFG